MCAAALSVSKQGGMESAPWAEEVARFARSKGLPDDCWNWNPCLEEIYMPESDSDDDGDDDGADDGEDVGGNNGEGGSGDKKKKKKKQLKEWKGEISSIA